MDSSRTSLPNVDRANSTLFKRYLDEQHKSVVKSSNYPSISRPINSTIEVTHQQQDTYTSLKSNQTVLVKRKYSNSRKPSADASKQRPSHTSRFMKRFQRQHKTGETLTNVQKRDGRPRFEFHEPNVTTSIRTDQEPQCTCTALVNEVHGNNYQHHHHCPAKPSQVPRLSLNNMFQSTSHSQRQSKPVIYPPLPMLPPTITDSFRQNSLPSPSIEQPPPPPTTTTTSHIESETLVLDPPITNLSNEYYPLINDFLQELSIEMTVKPSVDILLEIEESLAQRIYDCIVEQDDETETETDGQSHSTVTNDSSVAPAVPISANNITSNELPPSPISTTIDEPMDNQEKYFQPIREQPVDTFSNLLARHSTPFQQLTKPLQQADTRSPFTQSLFEPVNLLRTVHDDNENLNFFSSSFSFHPQQSTKSELSTSSFQRPSASFFNNHLLPPQQPTPNESNLSAFKPIEPLTIRPTGTYLLSRPQLIHHSTGVNWFGQS